MTGLKISYEFIQSEKKQPGVNYAMNFSYDSHTVTLVSVCVPFVSQKNKQNNLKMNVNTMRKTKKYSHLAAIASLMGGPLNLYKKKSTLKSGINS